MDVLNSSSSWDEIMAVLADQVFDDSVVDTNDIGTAFLTANKEVVVSSLNNMFKMFASQDSLMKEIVDKSGINIVTCGKCGSTVLHRIGIEEIYCPYCEDTCDACDMPDLI